MRKNIDRGTNLIRASLMFVEIVVGEVFDACRYDLLPIRTDLGAFL